MKTSELSFDLPRDLIAQRPPAERGRSRLFVADRRTGQTEHRMITDILDYVVPGTVMVFNDSRVRKARVYARASDTGVVQEFLLVAPREDDGNNGYRRWLVIGPGGKKLKPGRTFHFESSPGVTAEVTDVSPPYRELTFSQPIDEGWFEQNGHVPLPPYIHRADAPEDAQRYQTVYSRSVGSVAAPTAGLHFTEPLLNTLRTRGVMLCFVTLHVGIGTFMPVRTETLEEHVMHREEFTISDVTAEAINAARRERRPILAVGTTSVRALESAARVSPAESNDDSPDYTISPGQYATEIFIRPGYRFRLVDHLFTNFHTPESTLLALVSAFAGREQVLEWYRHAVEKRYRFFSYGDAMLIR